jgi:hypothetical protein
VAIPKKSSETFGCGNEIERNGEQRGKRNEKRESLSLSLMFNEEDKR